MNPKYFFENFVMRSYNDFIRVLDAESSTNEDIQYCGMTACVYANHMADHIRMYWLKKSEKFEFKIPNTDMLIEIKNDENNSTYKKHLTDNWPAYKVIKAAANSIKHLKVVYEQKWLNNEIEPDASAGSAFVMSSLATKKLIIEIKDRSAQKNIEHDVMAAIQEVVFLGWESIFI